MRLKILLTSIAVLAMGGVWLHEHLETIRLQAELDLARDAQRELASLQRENQRLKTKQPDTDRLAALRRAAAERDQLLLELEARNTAVQPPFSTGQWTPSSLWENRGTATPRNAVETALWAAAGGDTPTLESMLELEPDAVTKASALFNVLSPAVKGAYPSPTALIASVTTKNIPLGKAQVSWLHEFDPDHAVVGLVMSNPDRTSVAPQPEEAGAPPPMLPDDGKFKLLTLSLHRTNSGWHLVVPSAAVERIAQNLTAPNQ